MTTNECGHLHKDKKKSSGWKRCCAGILIFLFLVLLVLLIIRAVVRPSKPHFVLLDATVFAFNVTAPNLLNSTFQVTVQSTNPDWDSNGIYYDGLLIFASYAAQQITFSTVITPTYQDTNGVNIWSPFVSGIAVPIAPFIGTALKQDQSAGNLHVNFKIDGQVRWKVGTLLTGTYRLHVNCQATIPVESPNAGMIVINSAVKYQLRQDCGVEMSMGQGISIPYGDFPKRGRRY